MLIYLFSLNKTTTLALLEFQCLAVYGFELLRPFTAPQREPWTAFIGQDVEAR